jgi:branched-chain amino acid transport system substrate-binding protein
MKRRSVIKAAVATTGVLAAGMPRRGAAQAKAMPGITDTEILIGQTMPYSGPASSYGTIGRSEAAVFAMINEAGGINGRKIRFISIDDGYNSSKTVEQIRRLVEQDNVAAIFQMLGTPSVNATRRYLNNAKVPQIFVATGATQFGDHEHYPWTMGWQPTYQIEGHVYARYVLDHHKGEKTAVLYQNDDSGKDYLKGFKDGLGEANSKMLVATASFEVTDPTVDSQILSLRQSGATVLFATGVPKIAAMAIRKTYDIGWLPVYIMASVGSSVASGLAPAGLEKAVGHITSAYIKDPTDPQWANDPDFKAWFAWLKKYYPEGDVGDLNNAYGYACALTMVQVLKQCGADLSRENIMRQAVNLDFVAPMLQPGIRIKTGPADFYPIKQLRLVRFDGRAWVPFGEVISG